MEMKIGKLIILFFFLACEHGVSTDCWNFLVKWANNMSDQMPLSTLLDFAEEEQANSLSFASMATPEQVQRLEEAISLLKKSRRGWFNLGERRAARRRRNAILLGDPDLKKPETTTLADQMSEAEAIRRVEGEDQSHKVAVLRILVRLDELERDPGRNRKDIEALRKKRDEILNGRSVEDYALSLDIPREGINPIPFLGELKREVFKVNGKVLQKEGHFIWLPSSTEAEVGPIAMCDIPTPQLWYVMMAGGEARPSYFKPHPLFKIGGTVVDPARPAETIGISDVNLAIDKLNKLHKSHWLGKVSEWMQEDYKRQSRDCPIKYYQFRLPTLNELSYVIQAGTTTNWSFGDDPRVVQEFAWVWPGRSAPPELKRTQRVGVLKPNPWQFYDTHGQVWELTSTRWYPPDWDDGGPYFGSHHYVLGGSWEQHATHAHANFRGQFNTSGSPFGFRLVMEEHPLSPNSGSGW